MQRIEFFDRKLQEKFEDDGYIKINLLTEDEANELIAFYENHESIHLKDYNLHHTTTETKNAALIRLVDEKIKQITIPALNKILKSYKPLASCFHTKEIGKGSQTDYHQDPTFVDESKFDSANVWVALQDTHSTNGNLFFIPGSHRAVSSLRPIPFYPPYYASFKDYLPSLKVEVPLKKGEAVMFFNSTIHGATENLSDSKRLASTLLISSKDAEWLILENKVNQLCQYDLDFESFVEMNMNGLPPLRNKRAIFKPVFHEISQKHFIIKTRYSFFRKLHEMIRRKIVS